MGVCTSREGKSEPDREKNRDFGYSENNFELKEAYGGCSIDQEDCASDMCVEKRLITCDSEYNQRLDMANRLGDHTILQEHFRYLRALDGLMISASQRSLVLAAREIQSRIDEQLTIIRGFPPDLLSHVQEEYEETLVCEMNNKVCPMFYILYVSQAVLI
jgi:hypothetical protein